MYHECPRVLILFPCPCFSGDQLQLVPGLEITISKFICEQYSAFWMVFADINDHMTCDTQFGDNTGNDFVARGRLTAGFPPGASPGSDRCHREHGRNCHLPHRYHLVHRTKERRPVQVFGVHDDRVSVRCISSSFTRQVGTSRFHTSVTPRRTVYRYWGGNVFKDIPFTFRICL